MGKAYQIDFTAGEYPPEKVGFTQKGVEEVLKLFRSQQESQEHPGAQLVVTREGKVALDRWIGLAHRRQQRPVNADTPFLTFSTSKAFTAMCVHNLIAEGRLCLDDPIMKYWPEFGQNGKEPATLRHAFLHQLGLPSTDLEVLQQVRFWPNWDRQVRHIAGLKAKYTPGTSQGYHLVNNGFVLGEVVRRVTGKRIDQYLKETYLDPLGLKNTWLGLPREQFARASGLYAGEKMDKATVILFGARFVRSSVVPAATLHSTARDIAIFYQMLLNRGEYNGKQLIAGDAVDRALEVGYEGQDGTFRSLMRWAYGFALGGLPKEGTLDMGLKSTAATFGHNGLGSCMVWGDRRSGIVVAYLCNTLLPGKVMDARWQQMSDAIFEAAGV